MASVGRLFQSGKTATGLLRRKGHSAGQSVMKKILTSDGVVQLHPTCEVHQTDSLAPYP
jgi:hypothetical protein